MSASPARRRPRVVAIASHPIQYHAPWFRGLAASGEIDFEVLFVQIPDAQAQGKGFGIAFEWDVPLLEGYKWSRMPGVRGRGGFDGFFATRVAAPGRLLREIAPDAVIVTGWHAWPLVQMLFAAHAEGIPAIMRGEANALRKRPLAARMLHRILLSRCAACLPIGRSSRDFYRGYGIGEARLFDAPYFIDNARFQAAAAQALPARARLRNSWGIPAGHACFGYAGKLEPKKRILDLLAALRVARDHGTKAHLLVVGTGELEQQARSYVQEHALPVTFAGFLNQGRIADAYVAMDMLVLPSDYGETWGLVVNEAMACGRPALVSDRVGCGQDLVEPGRTGGVFPFGDVAALARALQEFASDPAQLEVMGANACEKITRHYAPGHAVSGTLAAIDHVMATR